MTIRTKGVKIDKNDNVLSISKNGDFYPYKLSNYVTLGDYWNAEYASGNPNVEDEDVEEKIKADLVKYKQTTSVKKEGTIKNGDTANIDYKGFLKGVQFEGGTADGYSLEIGSGSFIDGFESGLIGKKAGEEVSLDLKFPDSYHNAEFAGKEVTFEVKINSVTEVVYPELTDELVSKISSKKTVSEYRQHIYDTLVEEKAEEVAKTNRENLISAVIETCEIKKYPKDEVMKYKNNLITQYEKVAGNNGLDLETFVSYSGYTLDQFKELMEKNAQNIVAEEMIFIMIADKEGIELTESEFEAGVTTHMEENRYTSRDVFLDDIGEDKLRGILLIDKTIDYMLGNIENH